MSGAPRGPAAGPGGDRPLAGRSALVTGANHGIGAAIATRLAHAGADVGIAFLRGGKPGAMPTDGAHEDYRRAHRADGGELASELAAEAGVRAVPIEQDLSAPAGPEAVFEQAREELGKVEILIHNATYAVHDCFLPESGHGTAPVSSESLERHFALNVRAPALLTAAFARDHVRRGADWGRIVSLSTQASYGFEDEASYGATKAALESLTRCAALELGRAGITANVVSPGDTQTGWLDREAREAIAARTPLGRVGEPGDIADVVVFLATDAARWVTGQTIFAGGGTRLT